MRLSLPQAPRRIQAVSQHLLIQVKQPNSGCNVRLSGQPGLSHCTIVPDQFAFSRIG